MQITFDVASSDEHNKGSRQPCQCKGREFRWLRGVNKVTSAAYGPVRSAKNATLNEADVHADKDKATLSTRATTKATAMRANIRRRKNVRNRFVLERNALAARRDVWQRSIRAKSTTASDHSGAATIAAGASANSKTATVTWGKTDAAMMTGIAGNESKDRTARDSPRTGLCSASAAAAEAAAHARECNCLSASDKNTRKSDGELGQH